MVRGKAGPKPGPAKEPKEKKPRKVKVPSAEVSTVAGSNVIDRDMQALARHHRDKYITLKEAQNKSNRAMQAFGKVVKGDGLAMKQIKLMVELMTPEGEAAFKASVVADLMAAQWQGAEVGSQLSLFQAPDRTPSVDIAFDEGVADAMDGKTQNPKYAPTVPQYQRYLDGYAEEQERMVKKGIGSDVKPNPSRADVLAASRTNATDDGFEGDTKH